MSNNQEYFESEEFRGLLSQYEDSVKSGHPIYIDADDLADIADYYQYNGQPIEADEAISLALEYNPDAVGPQLYRAREALIQKDFQTAKDIAERIHAVDSREALYLQGEIMICEDKANQADSFFQAQMRNIMDDELMDYVYDIANIFSDYELHDKAFEWIVRSQGDDSDDFKELMARTLFGLGKYQDSERIFNELIDHNPYCTRYWNALASAQFMREDYEAAITSSEYAIAIAPNDPESLLSKANSLYNIGNFESALSYFSRYSKQADEDEFGYLYQGTCLINMGRNKEAIEQLKKAEERAEPDSRYLPEIYQELAFGYSELKKTETALYYLDLTRVLNCDHICMEIIRGHVLLANQRQEEAMKAFSEALLQSDDSAKTMLRIIVSLYDNQYINSAYTLLKQFLKNNKEDRNEGYAYMALCCMDLKKGEEFMHYLKIATDVNPKEAKTILGNLFPEGMDPKDYYNYMLNKVKRT